MDWTPIPGFPGYHASKEGLIGSNRCHMDDPEAIKPLSPAKIKPPAPKIRPGRVNHYFQVLLRRDGKTHPKLVHRLVLETFVGPCPEGHVTRHLNGDPTDNRLENLRWGTRSENQRDSVKHGTTGAYRMSAEGRRRRMLMYSQGWSTRGGWPNNIPWPDGDPDLATGGTRRKA